METKIIIIKTYFVTLYQTFKSSIFTLFKDFSNEIVTTRICLKLKRLYHKRLYMKKRLYQLHMDEGKTITNHLDILNKIILDLKSVDVNIQDEDLVVLLLCSLPNSYMDLIVTIMFERDVLTSGENLS